MNLKRIFLISCIVSLIVCAVPVLASTLTFTEKDSGTMAQVYPGDTIVLSLVENPSTNCRWIMVVSPGLILESDEYEPSGSGLIGAAGTRTWTYRVFDIGMLSISGIYKQASYKRGRMPTMGNEDTFTPIRNEDTFTLSLISGERNNQNARSIQWGEIVPRFDRLEMDLDRLEELTNRYPERLGLPRELF